VSWQTASFAIVGAGLLGGFAWYERSRPPSQVVALVAALAALAIAGRVAFAALPNVKPTTDIVVFAGYALGPAPGFAVGALAALVSNFWFGQGPWTPWQMAGWGICGLLGALLALGVRNAGRLSLAATCGLAAVIYGALLNFSLMATYGGDLTVQRFLALEARAIPFEAAHLAGNVALAILAGPAMVRMLGRFRRRFEWRRGAPPGRRLDERRPALGAGTLALFLAAALCAFGTLVAPPAARADVDEAAGWLAAAQNSDGGFGTSPGADSSPEITGWAMLGLEAAGRNPLDVTTGGRSPVAYLRAQGERITTTGDLARTILALEGAGVNPRSFAGRDLAAELAARRRDNGSFEGWPNDTAYSVLALRDAGVTGGLQSSVDWLVKVQNDDGGWGIEPGVRSDPDTTGAVMQAIPGTRAARRGLSYLRDAQRGGGGWGIGTASPADAQSTARVAQGILAVGANPGSFVHGGDSPLDYLAARQAPDGHYSYSADSDRTPVWVTAEALVAAAGKSLPLAVPPREPREAPPKPPSPSPSSSNAIPTAPEVAAPQSGSTSSEIPPGAGSAPVPPPSAGGGGFGSPRERFAPSGPTGPVAPAIPTAPGGRVSGGSETAPSTTGVLASQTIEPSDPPSPWPPILIGVLATAAAIGGTWWLGRRRGW
jgi:energy-coupling factor transport system substrate-specific component